MQKIRTGFSLMEFMIVLIVIAILGAITWPFYNNYVHRYYYKPILQAVDPIKSAVSACYEKFEKLAVCNGGTHHIPANSVKPVGPIDSLTVVQGVITAIPVPSKYFTKSDTYILSPSIQNNQLTWHSSGGSIDRQYAD